MSSITDVRSCAMELERIDTHSHFVTEMISLADIANNFDDFVGKGDIVGSRICALGCRELYGIDCGPFLRPDSPREVFEQAAALRALGPKPALERALDTEKISMQLCFADHHPENWPVSTLSPRVRVVTFIDAAIIGKWAAFCPDSQNDQFNYYESLIEQHGRLGQLDDLLGSLDALVDSWRRMGMVVGVKTAFAYTIGLQFSDPTIDEARAAFSKKHDMTREDMRTVHDYAFRHVLLACRRNHFPIVIHTGFQIWGHANLEQSNPMLLHNLLIDERYKDLTFVLLHGGNPYVGETTYLARMFPNVILDFTWISWMTQTRFRFALGEWLENVPHGRFCWGSDSGEVESIVGIGRLVRQGIADVLEDSISRGVLDERAALDFIRHTYDVTPRRVFGL